MRLLEIIKKAKQKGWAIGHFNFAETTVLRAAVAAAEELNAPIILGTSESEREFLGIDLIKSIFGLRKTLRSSEDQPLIFFNADHTKSLEKVKEAVEAGYDAILFDGSDLPLEENIRRTKEVVEYVKSQKSNNPAAPAIIVEGEIGFIGSGSQLRDAAPEGVQLTTPEEAARFVKETGVDLLAPAVGNIHGIIKSGEPRLDIARIAAIKKAVSIPLVLHGASGNSDEDIRAAIKAGVSIVHINTEIRLAWRDALAEFLKTNLEEIAPYKILADAKVAAKKVIIKKLKLFNLCYD